MPLYSAIQFYIVPADTGNESKPFDSWTAALAWACRVHNRRRVPVDVWARQRGRAGQELLLQVDHDRLHHYGPWGFPEWYGPPKR
jgi:hypothetical protein